MRQVLKVDFDKIICEEFLGMNAVYHGFGYMKEYELRGGCDADVDREIAYAKKSKFENRKNFFCSEYKL